MLARAAKLAQKTGRAAAIRTLVNTPALATPLSARTPAIAARVGAAIEAVEPAPANACPMSTGQNTNYEFLRHHFLNDIGELVCQRFCTTPSLCCISFRPMYVCLPACAYLSIMRKIICLFISPSESKSESVQARAFREFLKNVAGAVPIVKALTIDHAYRYGQHFHSCLG